MAEALFDQNAWLKRIGYAGSLEPTLSTLHELIFAHEFSFDTSKRLLQQYLPRAVILANSIPDQMET
jgi:arylamine N-acetyltransferase